MESFITKFSDILQKIGAINTKQAQDLKKDFKSRSSDAVIYFLLDEGIVTKENILKALSQYYNMPSFDVSGYFFEHDLVSGFSPDFLRSNSIIPLTEENDILTVVAADPEIPGLTPRIEKHTDATVQYVVGLKRDIWDAIREFSELSVTEDSYEELDNEEEEAEEEHTDIQDSDYY